MRRGENRAPAALAAACAFRATFRSPSTTYKAMTAQHRMPASDRELAETILRTGAEGAFRELYRRHTPRLLQLGRRLLGGDVSDAEDAVQETWIRAIAGLGRFRWESLFSTWLLGIGIHVCRDILRKRRSGREDPWDDSLQHPGPDWAPSERIGERVDLERAIALLPDGYRTVLVLHDVEGMAHEAIAARLDITIGTSKSQLHRARRALRLQLVPVGK